MSRVDDAMHGAWSALLRGDYAERDRLCAEANKALQVEKIGELAAATVRVMAIDFYVTKTGIAYPTKAMAKAAGVI